MRDEEIREYVLSNDIKDNLYLSDAQRSALFLKFVKNSNYVDIAKYIGISAPQAKKTLERAIHLLCISLKEKSSDMLIEDSQLPKQVKNSLTKMGGFKHLKDLDGVSEERLLCLYHFGKTGLEQLKEYVEDLDIQIKQKEPTEPKLKFHNDLFKNHTETEILFFIEKLSNFLRRRITPRAANTESL